MKGNCQEHSKSLQLISLKIKLEKENPDPSKKQDLLQRIKLLEKELKLD